MSEFSAALIATDPAYGFVFRNCIQIDGCMHIYEGELSLFDEQGLIYRVVGFSSVPSLGGIGKVKLKEIILNRFGLTRARFNSLRREYSELFNQYKSDKDEALDARAKQIKEKLSAEVMELAEKHDKLKAFKQTEAFESLEVLDRLILDFQDSIMAQYISILQLRHARLNNPDILIRGN